MDLQEYLDAGDTFFLPNISIDIVIVGFHEGQLKVLLVELNGNWGLPGGHIKRDESTSDAAQRILKERTGLSKQHLQLCQLNALLLQWRRAH